MGKTWRDSAKPVIAEVIKANQGKPLKEIKKALREAYPFGERAMHPYKIWCDEVRIQLRLKKKKIRGETDNPNQLKMI